jgi:hypothetical protein
MVCPLLVIANAEDNRIPPRARFCLEVLARQYASIAAEVGAIDKRIHAWHRLCEESRRLEAIPGIGPIVATALVAEIGDWKTFRSGRSLAAWIGLVPKHRRSINRGEPRPLLGPVLLCVADDGHGARNQEPSQVAIALFDDAAEFILTPGRMLHKGGCSCIRQQDGTDGLGHHGS